MVMYKNGAYWIDYIVQGRRRVEKTTLTAQTLANKAKAKKLQDEARVRFKDEVEKIEALSVRNKRGKIVDQPIHEAFSDYYERQGQYAKGKGPQNILRELAYAEAFFGPDVMIGDLDAEALIDLREFRRKDYVKHRTKDGLPAIDRKTGERKALKLVSNRTVNMTIEAVRWALGWLEKNGRAIQKIDWRVVMLEEDPRVTEFKTEHEVLVLEKFRPDYLPCLLFMLEAGPRKGQAVALKWSDIDWDRRTITLLKQKKRGAKRTPKPHRIPITSEIERLLMTQIDPETQQPYHPTQVWTYCGMRTRTDIKSGRKFEMGRRYPIEYQGISSAWARFKRQHSIEDVRLHDLRHAAGTRTLQKTQNLALVRDLLGHSTVTTTERYAHTGVELLRAALEQASARARGQENITRAEKTHTEIHTELV